MTNSAEFSPYYGCGKLPAQPHYILHCKISHGRKCEHSCRPRSLQGMSPAFCAILTSLVMRNCCRLHSPVTERDISLPSPSTNCSRISTSEVKNENKIWRKISFKTRPRFSRSGHVTEPRGLRRSGQMVYIRLISSYFFEFSDEVLSILKVIGYILISRVLLSIMYP